MPASGSPRHPFAAFLIAISCWQPAAPPQSTGVISGIVTDASTGRPLRRVRVACLGNSLEHERVAVTEPDGRYEFSALPPGTYVVSAIRTGYLAAPFGASPSSVQIPTRIVIRAGQTFSAATIGLVKSAAITGRLTDERGEPSAGIEVSAVQLVAAARRQTRHIVAATTITDDDGAYRLWGLRPGRYIVSTLARRTGPGGNGAFAPARLYYPGVPHRHSATVLTIGVGAEIAGIDVIIRKVRLADLSGTVQDASGAPVRPAFVAAIPRGGAADSIVEGAGRESGAFVIPRVPPGEYDIVAVSRPAQGPLSIGSLRVTVDEQDALRLAVRTLPAARLRGAINPAPADGSVRLTSVSDTADDPFYGLPQLARYGFARTVTGDGAFDLHVPPGARRLVVTSADGRAVTLASFRIGAGQPRDEPIRYAPADEVSGISLTVEYRTGDVSGHVAAGEPGAASGAVLVVVSGAEVMRVDRAPQDGDFTLRGLPFGRYSIAALPATAAVDPSDDDLVKAVARLGTTIVVGESPTPDLSLTLTPAPRT